MDTLNTGFIWEYDDNSFEEKNLLIDSLPEGFKYRVKKLKIIEKSDVKEEVKFQTQIQVIICDKDEAENEHVVDEVVRAIASVRLHQPYDAEDLDRSKKPHLRLLRR